MSQGLKLLLWSPPGAGTHYSGPGTSMYRMFTAYLPPSWSVTLVHGNPNQERYPIFQDQVFLGSVMPVSPWRQVSFLATAHSFLSRNNKRFDVFLGIDAYESTVRPAYWAQRFGLNAVVRPASFMSGIGKSRRLSMLLSMARRRQMILPQLAGVIAISRAIEASLLDSGCDRNRLHYIPNGINTTRFAPSLIHERQLLREQLGWPKQGFIVLFVGGLSARKRPEWIVEAIALARDKGRNIFAAFVGPEREKNCRARLQAQATRLGINDRLLWHHHTDTVETFYQASDIFCLPSSREGMSNALLEAAACGLPMLATHISGSEEIVRHGENGFFISSISELADSLRKLERDPALCERLGNVARRDALERFDALKMWNRYATVLESLRARN